MTPAYRFPANDRFRCEGCTQCCRQFAVPVSDAEAAALAPVKNRHGLEDPFDRGPAGDRVLRRVGGACVFLELDGRCAVHAQIGFALKPLACRQFPFTTVADPAGTRFVRASFSCPTVLASRGDGPDELAPQIERDVEPAPLPPTLKLGSLDLTHGQYAALEDLLTEWISAAPHLPRALAATGALMPALESGRPATRELLEQLAADARPFSRRDARLLLAPFLLLSAPPDQSRPSRALHAVRLLAGRGRFRTWTAAADVPLAAQAQVRWSSDREAPGGLVRRYLLHLLRSRVFLPGLPVETQVNLIGVAYALVRWNARARAALDGRDAVTDADVARAVQDTDREHFGHNATEARLLTSSLIGLWLDLMFRGPRRLAGLILEA